MAIVVNVRGLPGAGKTELVRRVLSWYGQGKDAVPQVLHEDELRAGRVLGHLVGPASDGSGLAVIGSYARRSGGCDTIRGDAGGCVAAIAAADRWACAGHAVLLEGLALSCEADAFSALSPRHRLHVIRLTTPLALCAENLSKRRRTARARTATLMKGLVTQERAIDDACARLSGIARVHRLGFDDALARVRSLVGPPAADRAAGAVGSLQGEAASAGARGVDAPAAGRASAA